MYKGDFNKDICRACGECCKQSGCGYIPSDFERMSYDYLKSKLEEGNISIMAHLQFDNNDAGERCWYFVLQMQARNIGREIIDLVSYDSCCSMLTENGCSYSDEERPAYGRNLKPDINHDCKQQIPYKDGINAWLKYQDVLSSLVTYYTHKGVAKAIEDDIDLLKKEIVRRYPDYFVLTDEDILKQIETPIVVDEETIEFLNVLQEIEGAKFSIDGSPLAKKYAQKRLRKKKKGKKKK